jgi:integration host factor subunit alpha
MTITKAHLIDSIYNNVGFSRTKSIQLVESIVEIMKATLEEKKDVLISGFGKFSVKEKRTRRGRNPATGQDLILNERRVITFKCSSVFRDKINGKAPSGE